MIAFEKVVKVMEEVIKVNNLYKLYKVGDEIVHALDGVDFTVRRGEFCAIVGTSGSGKSTLLNMLAGLERPTRGSIVIGGQKIEHLSEEELVAFRREKVGFIFQSFHLLGTLNAVENVALPLSFRGEARQHRMKKAEAMIKLVGLEKHKKHMPNQMSGGQQQRVGVARALVVDPQIIFADEPTGNLDSHTAEEIMTLMQQVVRKHNKTLVAGGIDEYNANSYYAFCDLETLKQLLKKEFSGRAIPGQPQTKNGKPMNKFCYTYAEVKVDDADHVTTVSNQIKEMGYQVETNAELMDSMKRQMAIIQAVLGGIGAVSLFVAAIGIANTMMMSIYERTKEIGVMKVLGCSLKNIKKMFLMEAGLIGVIGGIIGNILSFLISAAINTLASSAGVMNEMAQISYIPIWLMLASIGFAMLVGLLAGYFPAKRAMKLSPLEAIRH